MKKLFLSTLLLLGTFATFAFESTFTNQIKEVVYQEEYKEIGLEAVPDAVKATLEKSFPNTKLVKAYTNEKGEYKLEISHGEKSYTVFTDAQGNIIKK